VRPECNGRGRVADERELHGTAPGRRAWPLHLDRHVHRHRSMNHRAACVTVVAAMLLASPLADASSAPPAIALTASPAHVDLTGTAMATVRLTNSGPDRVRVDVSRAGFSLDVRGRPKIVSVARERRSAAPWLMFRPRIVSLAPHRSASVTIASVLPS